MGPSYPSKRFTYLVTSPYASPGIDTIANIIENGVETRRVQDRSKTTGQNSFTMEHKLISHFIVRTSLDFLNPGA